MNRPDQLCIEDGSHYHSFAICEKNWHFSKVIFLSSVYKTRENGEPETQNQFIQTDPETRESIPSLIRVLDGFKFIGDY